MLGPLKTVGIYISDIDVAEAFYRDTLEFVVRRNEPMGPSARWLEMSPPGAETALVVYDRVMMQDWAERKPSVVFHCPDVAGTIETLRERGVTISMEPTEMPFGVFAAIEDLDGNQLGMTSQPLA